MRYMIINGLNEKRDGQCAFCGTSLGQTYTRDLSTGLPYHSWYCLEMHTLSSVAAITGNAVQHVEIL